MKKLSSTMPTAWNFVDLTGRKFGRLTVVGYAGKRNERSFWNCSCECGGSIVISACAVNAKRNKSCGCQHSETTIARNKANAKHGHCPKGAPSPEYYVYTGMKARCFNKKNIKYYLYGGRGITVCDRWKNSFENFLTDMGPRPSLKHTLDRYPNNDGNYEPGNCRWANAIQQRNNRRDSIKIKGDHHD